MVEVARSNVKPPTVHKSGVAVDGLKIQGAAIVTADPKATEVKLPLVLETVTADHTLTSLAVAKEVVSYAAVPAKAISPVMRTAWACWLNSAQLMKPVASAAKIILFFICTRKVASFLPKRDISSCLIRALIHNYHIVSSLRWQK
jgi:hypothetical protein